MARNALVFDAGNTLVFLDEHALAGSLRGAGLSLEPAALRSALGPANAHYTHMLSKGAGHDEAWDGFMATLLKVAGLGPGRIAGAVQVARAAHAKRNLWRRVDPSLRASLESVREAGFVLGVISNSEGALDVLFREVGLSGLFDEVVDSHYEGIRKPDPRIFRRACERLRVEPERTVYVGDLPAVDVLGAREAGLGAVLVDAYDLYPTYDLVPRFRTAQEVCAWFLAGGPVDRACTEGR